MARASVEQKASLGDTFVTLCEIESPSGRERAVQDWIRSQLGGRPGLELHEDDTAAETGADCGNLLVRIPGSGPRKIMFCAHIDTVPLEDGIEVELSNGVYRNRKDAILGADNKAAVAILVELARQFSSVPAEVGLELLFTTSEEIGLRGAKAFDVSLLESEFGYAFDHATPIGELIVAAPTYFRVEARFRGRSAHAGIRPEDGRNAIVAAAAAIGAIETGRIDERTTANIGRIEGGTATNVVAEHCLLELEVRSLDDQVAHERVQQAVDSISWAAAEHEVDVDTTVEQDFAGYEIRESEPVVLTAMAALDRCGIRPVLRPTGGGSDANAFQAKGFHCMNMANATEANHTPDEKVSAAALETMLDVALSLVECAAEAH